MIIVYPHLPEQRPQDKETFDFIQNLSEIGYKIHEITTPRDNPFAYHQGLKSIWGKDDMIIIESDVVPTMKQFNHLINCKEPNCTMDNQILNDNHDGLRTALQIMENGKQRWAIKGNDNYCDLTGMTCVKISKQLQIDSYSWFMKENYFWKYMDYVFWERAGVKIHIHWDIPKHNHVYKYHTPKIEDTYDLNDYQFMAIVEGTLLVYHKKSQIDPNLDNPITCIHVLKLPLTCRSCMKIVTDQIAKERALVVG